MLTYDLIYLSRIKHEEMIADAEKWSGRAYGIYSRESEAGPSRIAAAIASLQALFARKPANALKTASNVQALRAATK